jgi:hypothetical protein
VLLHALVSAPAGRLQSAAELRHALAALAGRRAAPTVAARSEAQTPLERVVAEVVVAAEHSEEPTRPGRRKGNGAPSSRVAFGEHEEQFFSAPTLTAVAEEWERPVTRKWPIVIGASVVGMAVIGGLAAMIVGGSNVGARGRDEAAAQPAVSGSGPAAAPAAPAAAPAAQAAQAAPPAAPAVQPAPPAVEPAPAPSGTSASAPTAASEVAAAAGPAPAAVKPAAAPEAPPPAAARPAPAAKAIEQTAAVAPPAPTGRSTPAIATPEAPAAPAAAHPESPPSHPATRDHSALASSRPAPPVAKPAAQGRPAPAGRPTRPAKPKREIITDNPY